MRLLRKCVAGVAALATLSAMGSLSSSALAADAVVGGGSDATVKLTLANAPADPAGWTIGETMRFNVELTNKGAATFGFQVTDTNLENTVKCKWQQAVANRAYPCNEIITHTVTQEDMARGTFDPSVTYSKYTETNYGGTATALAPATAATQTIQHKDYTPATAFETPDADPALDPALTELTPIARTVPGQYSIRIPAIAVASNGDLLASFDKRPVDGGANGGDAPNANSIMQSRSTDGGKTWGTPTVIAQGDKGDGVDPATRTGYSDPSYVVDHETGTIFNFHVYSKAIGAFSTAAAVIKAAQQAGTTANPDDIILPAYTYKADGSIDETLATTVNLGLSVSEDNGNTWTQRVITDQVLRDVAGKYNLQSCFATSGAGTQKLREPHKGRLLQQLTCPVYIPENNDTNPDNNKFVSVVALTVYSDDHGTTWHAGTPTPTSYDGKIYRFDENKVVELSDGKLLMSSRTWRDYDGDAANTRLLAVSEDGGETWGDYRYSDPELIDPGNNAQVIRAYPNARPGTLRSKVLLHSYTNSTSGANGWNDRIHGTIAMSLDDGATWPISKEFRAGGTGYTTMATLPSGRIGLLMEPEGDGWQSVYYQSFTMGWVDPALSTELSIAPATRVKATVGQKVSIPLNTKHNDPALTDTVELSGLPAGFTYNEATDAIEGTVGASLVGTRYAGVTITEADDGTGLPRTAHAAFTLVVDAADPDPTEPGVTDPDPAEPGVSGSVDSGKGGVPVGTAVKVDQVAKQAAGTASRLASTGASVSLSAVVAASLSLLGLALLRKRAHGVR